MTGTDHRQHQVRWAEPGPNTGDTYLVTTSGERWLQTPDLDTFQTWTGRRIGVTDGCTIWEMP